MVPSDCPELSDAWRARISAGGVRTIPWARGPSAANAATPMRSAPRSLPDARRSHGVAVFRESYSELQVRANRPDAATGASMFVRTSADSSTAQGTGVDQNANRSSGGPSDVRFRSPACRRLAILVQSLRRAPAVRRAPDNFFPDRFEKGFDTPMRAAYLR